MTSRHRTTAQERRLRIEMARARAGLERRAVVRDACRVAHALQPRAMLHSIMPRMSYGSAADWIMRIVSVTRRYPLLTSGASALLTGIARRKGKRKLLWRVGAGLLVAWQVARKATGDRGAPADRDIDLPRGRMR